jgi:hypothetical protein
MCRECCVLQVEVSETADHSSRGVLPTVVCLSVIVKPGQTGSPGPIMGLAKTKKK